MSTHSLINYYKNGIVKTIYCHWDGYLSHNGKILLLNYNTEDKIEHLLSFGDISSLADDISKCEFYKRDRNETGTDARETDVGEITNVKNFPIHELEEYNYLFFNNQWYFIGYVDVGDGIDFENWTILTLNFCQ